MRVKQESILSADKIQPRQIICLEHENSCLYTEVIDVVTSRQVCWVRPLLLAISPIGNDCISAFLPEQLKLYDLREASDLLWPAILFRLAIDTEVIPLLVQLDDPNKEKLENHTEAHNQLSCFVRKVWQASKNAF